MHLSRRNLLAAGLGAICTGAAGAQQKPQPKGVIVGEKPFDSDKMRMSAGGKTLKEWIAEISSPDPSRRENAIRTIPLIKGNEAAIPALLERLDKVDSDSSPRVNAVMALGAVDITGARDDEIKHIVRTLANRAVLDREAIIRFQAALVLGRFGAKARPATRELIQATKDMTSWEIRKAAVFSLTRAISDTVEFVNHEGLEAIYNRMKANVESSALVRLEAVMSVATIGRVGKIDNDALVSALKTAENDKEKAIKIWARVGLCVHDNSLTSQDMKALVKFLSDKDLPARTHAARALGTIGSIGNPGPLIKEAIGPLTEMLNDPEEHGQIAAIWALGRIGPPAQPALKKLDDMLTDKTISDEGKGFIREAIASIQGKGEKK
jgi:HEAT repeat protein